MPKIKDISPNLCESLKEFKKMGGIKSIYVWGSYAKNIDNPNFRVRDIDILARTQFDSGDLLSITNDVVNSDHTDSYLEDQGYDPLSVAFSKKFLKLSNSVDCWATSADRKLLHWGPILVNVNDSQNINKEAEDYASRNAGITRQKINSSSEKNRNSWFDHYLKYVDRCFDGMPTGWYKTEDIKIKTILKQAIKL